MGALGMSQISEEHPVRPPPKGDFTCQRKRLSYSVRRMDISRINRMIGRPQRAPLNSVTPTPTKLQFDVPV